MHRDATRLIPRKDPEVRERRVAAVLALASGAFVLCASLWWWSGSVSSALGFTLALGFILGSHEAGHYAAARWHGTAVGPPLVLPVGMVMRLREPPADRVGLAALGLSGPVAGLAAMAVVLIARGSPVLGESSVHLGQPLLLRLAGGPPVTIWDPLGLAICIGGAVTAVNLLPWGQLDGGHILAAMAPRRARTVGWLVTAWLLVAAFLWPGWALWAALIHVAGNRHPMEPRKGYTEPPSSWFLVAWGLALALTFTVAPVAW